ncbi:hypothetical protein [Desulfitobacterium sp. AusDCA]
MNLNDNIGVVHGKSNGWSVPIIGILAVAALLFFAGRVTATQPVGIYN